MQVRQIFLINRIFSAGISGRAQKHPLNILLNYWMCKFFTRQVDRVVDLSIKLMGIAIPQ